MWIDIDIGFDADAVERLRVAHSCRSCAASIRSRERADRGHVLPGTPKIVRRRGRAGRDHICRGRLFLHVRREAYEAIRDTLHLPLCNTRFGKGMWPSSSRLIEDEGVPRYLTEDFAFSYRARQAGLRSWQNNDSAVAGRLLWLRLGRSRQRCRAF